MGLKITHLSLIFSGLTLWFSPAWAGYQFYGADLEEASWRTSGNRLECRLSQDIPGYGKATFKHRALQAVEFRVSSSYTPRNPGQALMFVEPPDWKKYAVRKVLGRVPLNNAQDTIVLPDDWAQRMALELREGMEAVWTHGDWADGQDLVTARVSPLRFETAWREFESCAEQLIDYGYDDVSASEFYFSKTGMTLSASEKKYLDRLAEYVSLDTDFQHIYISSHTDSRGVRRLNQAVSQKRADMVKKYLVDKGVNPKRFVIVAMGEQNPRYDNRTKTGRAKNRRVEVKLVK